MKAYAIDPAKRVVKEIDINIEANTVYTFFNSILIDELPTLSKHVIYSDANALSQKRTAFFFGGQIIVGELLILGREDFNDVEATIPQDELESLVEYEIPQFYKDVLEILSATDVNLYRTFEVEKEQEKIALNLEWVLYTFNIADERTKEYFIDRLRKVIESNEDVEEYIVKMATLAVKSAS